MIPPNVKATQSPLDHFIILIVLETTSTGHEFGTKFGVSGDGCLGCNIGGGNEAESGG